MTAPAVIRSGVGLRHFQIMAIGSDGYPAATNTTVYEGVQLSGVKTVGLNDPDPQLVSHSGDDNVFMQDSLPPQEGITGTITVAKTNDTIDAILTDDKSVTVGEAKIFGEGTSNKGLENDVIALTYRQARDTDPDSAGFGNRVWEFKLIPKCAIIPKAEGFAENTGSSKSYTVRPGFSTKHAWGAAFSSATDGYTRAQMIRGVTQYEPHIATFKGNGTVTNFLFNTAYPAYNASKVDGIWVDGVQQTTGYTAFTTGVAFSSAPSSGANLFCLYEKA